MSQELSDINKPQTSVNGQIKVEAQNIKEVEQVEQVEQSKSTKFLKFLKMNLLVIFLIISIIIGIGMGIGLRNNVDPDNQRVIIFIKFPGELLMRMLKMFVLPLIVSSLIVGLSEMNSQASKKIGLRTILYYFLTTFLAILLGIFLVLTIKPGADKSFKNGTYTSKSSSDDSDPVDSFLDLIRNLFPENVVEAAFRTTRTTRTLKPGSNNTYTYKTSLSDSSNIIGVVFFSIFVGVTIGYMGENGKPVANFFHALNTAVMKLLMLVMWYSPIGIIFLIATEIVKMSDPMLALQQLGLYIVTVLVGLIIHGFIVLPLLYLAFTRKNPIPFVIRMGHALATAFGTSSSSATLPVTIKCLEEKNRIDERISRLVLPIGATINMDGTALYEAVAPIFIAQLNGIHLNAAKVIVIFLTATCASIGAAAIPQAGLVTMVMVLTAAGIPTDEIARILAVDWFLDRCRTTINVLGDSIGAGIISHLSKKDLKDHNEYDEQLSTTFL